MTESLVSLVTDRWYGASIAAGGAVAGAALAASHQGALCVGLGLLLIGIGEFINHPFVQIPITVNGWGEPMTVREGRPRHNSIGGLLLAGIGILLLGAGVVRVALF